MLLRKNLTTKSLGHLHLQEHVLLMLLESLTLIGPESYVKDRIAAFKAAGVTLLDLQPVGANTRHAPNRSAAIVNRRGQDAARTDRSRQTVHMG